MDTEDIKKFRSLCEDKIPITEMPVKSSKNIAPAGIHYKESSIKFPFVDEFEDYHDIEELGYTLRKYTKERISYKEIGFINGVYIGLFWLKGQKVSKTDVNTLLKMKFGISLKAIQRDDELSEGIIDNLTYILVLKKWGFLKSEAGNYYSGIDGNGYYLWLNQNGSFKLKVKVDGKEVLSTEGSGPKELNSLISSCEKKYYSLTGRNTSSL